MTSPPLPLADVEGIVRDANTAPSGDNNQPWRFRWDGASLTILHVASRARHVADHRHLASYLTLGCVLEATRVAAAARGYDVDAALDLDAPHEADVAPWARVRFEPGSRREAADRSLHAALQQRRSDRRRYRPGSPAHPVFDELRALADREAGARLHLLHAPPPALVDYLARADAYAWRNPALYADIMRWVRFTPEEVAATRDGVPLQAIGVDLPSPPGLGLVTRAAAQRIIDRLRLFDLSGRWVESLITSATALLVVTVAGESREELVAAGRLGLAAWLRLTRAGYAAQPLTLQTLPVYQVARGGLPEGTRPGFDALFTRGRGLLAQGFGYAPERLPVWGFRAGPSSPLPARMETLRLPLDRIFTAVGDDAPISATAPAASDRSG